LPMRHRGRYKLHLGTAEVPGVLSLLEREEARAGVPRLAQVLLAEPVAAVYGQPFVLRAESPPATLGGGRVLQPAARRYRRRDQASVERLGRLRSADPAGRVGAALSFLGFTPWTERRLSALVGMPVEEIKVALDALSAAGGLFELPVGPRRTVRVLGEFA